jgi:transcriptional regulator with XRE-family HTH domain
MQRSTTDMNSTLARLLHDRCISRKVLARRANVTETAISFIVSGKRCPRPGTRKRIAEVLNVEPRTLFPFREDHK